MKNLILVRHAKSDWGNEHLKDIDRHLNERGYSDAYLLSNWFVKNQPTPDIILSSTATRALNTALIFARALDFNMTGFFLNETIYESTFKNLLTIIKDQPNSVNSIMLFCHNPGITNLYNCLCENNFIDNIPTCGIVNVTFETKFWKEISETNSKLNFLQFPKDYKNI